MPPDTHSCHFIEARVHRYADGRLALFHGARKLANYARDGQRQGTDGPRAA